MSGFYFSHSQSLDLGLRGSLGAAYFINDNVLKAGAQQGYRFSLSDNYGLQAAFNFHTGSGLETGILICTLRQDYGGSFNNLGDLPGVGITYQAGESYWAESKINIIQIPFLYRFEHKTGSYFEIGTGYEIISGGTYSATYSKPSFSVNYNTSNQYPVGNFLLMGGLGRNKKLSKTSNFYLNVGVRLTYGLMDIQGVDGHGQDLSGPESSLVYYPNKGIPYYAAYHETHSIDVSLNAGIFYCFSFANIHAKQIKL